MEMLRASHQDMATVATHLHPAVGELSCGLCSALLPLRLAVRILLDIEPSKWEFTMKILDCTINHGKSWNMEAYHDFSPKMWVEKGSLGPFFFQGDPH